MANMIVEMKKYLGTPDRSVDMDEFKDFWNSCSDTEKAEFKEQLEEELT